jgi:hypothetical protein
VLVGTLGLNGSLAACGAAALGYALQLLSSSSRFSRRRPGDSS